MQKQEVVLFRANDISLSILNNIRFESCLLFNVKVKFPTKSFIKWISCTKGSIRLCTTAENTTEEHEHMELKIKPVTLVTLVTICRNGKSCKFRSRKSPEKCFPSWNRENGSNAYVSVYAASDHPIVMSLTAYDRRPSCCYWLHLTGPWLLTAIKQPVVTYRISPSRIALV